MATAATGAQAPADGGAAFEVVHSAERGRSPAQGHPGGRAFIVLGGHAVCRMRIGRRERDYLLQPGSCVSYRAGSESAGCSWRGAVRSLHFDVQRSGLEPEAAAPGAGGVVVVHDRVLHALALALAQTAARPDDRLHADTLALALAERLRVLHGSGPAGGDHRPLLSPSVARLLREHIDRHLAQDLRIAPLAALVGMSASHFATAFRNTFGLAVHQYVLARRVDRARALLGGDHSLAEIALETGFSSQSHFTQAFGRAVGTPPGRLRAAGHPANP